MSIDDWMPTTRTGDDSFKPEEVVELRENYFFLLKNAALKIPKQKDIDYQTNFGMF